MMTTISFNWVGMNRSKGGQRDGDDGVARRWTGPKRVGANIGTKRTTMVTRRDGVRMTTDQRRVGTNMGTRRLMEIRKVGAGSETGELLASFSAQSALQPILCPGQPSASYPALPIFHCAL